MTIVKGDPDATVLRWVSRNPNLLIPHFLMASYSYYVLDAPLLKDDTFDEIVRRLDANWAGLEHGHKALLDPSLLKTGFYLKDYPLITIHAAEGLKELFEEKQ